MNAVVFSRVAGTLFLLVALAHLYRLVAHLPIQLGSHALPDAVSWVAVIVSGTLGLLGMRARAS